MKMLNPWTRWILNRWSRIWAQKNPLRRRKGCLYLKKIALEERRESDPPGRPKQFLPRRQNEAMW
jgi:hypothetical protein